MHRLIRWYKNSPPCFRVVFRTTPGVRVEPAGTAPPRHGRKRLLVVCAGNACRSPFAAAMLQRRLNEDQWQVLSAGTDAVEGRQVSETMRIAAREHGIDLSRHVAHRIDAAMLRTCEVIIAMSRQQADKLVEIEPSVARRIRLLGGFDPRPNGWGLSAAPRESAARAHEIGDPAVEDFEFHRQRCARLDAAVTRLSTWLQRREEGRPLPKPRAPVAAPALGPQAPQRARPKPRQPNASPALPPHVPPVATAHRSMLFESPPSRRDPSR